jgi:hypothetical protein
MLRLRCKLDGLILPAWRNTLRPTLLVRDGDEVFELEKMEAAYYELIEATADDLLWLAHAGYRLLRPAPDFRLLGQLRGA